MKALLALVPVLALASCATSPLAPPAAPGTVDHVVLIWLKKPGNAADKQAISATADELRAIPGMKFYDKGTALQSDRPVVDDSFDFALVSRFESAAALQAYETHPLHQKKVAEVLKPLSKKIVVYDVTR
ncbi:Dabb family protein [Luteolibacter sp. LG18]|uniref:Dabb family protein n=1 Tax=Luteolibacter sp. LG18 TaxID=2819286 RepID=UPI002B30E334|nr:hypothetical protein llg_08590 [Luteolibacter sp. LG18]